MIPFGKTHTGNNGFADSLVGRWYATRRLFINVHERVLIKYLL